WKGVKLNVIKDKNAPLELYDLSKDPKEQHNVAAAHMDIVQQMNSYIKSEHIESDVFPLTGK
ncbi:MAG TPA: arylsulfatase, partial [Chitinophaga sp.]